MCLWIGAFFLDLPNMLGWGDHTYDMKTMACSYDRVASYSFTLFFITMFVTIPLCTVVFSNIHIYITVVKSRMRVTAHKQQTVSSTESGVTFSEKMSCTENGDYESSVSHGAKKGAHNTNELVVGNDNSREVLHGPKQKDGRIDATQVNNEKESMGEKYLQPPKTLTIPSQATTLKPSKKNQIPNKQQTKKVKERKQEVKLAKTLFLVFIAFCFCWTPYGILVLVDIKDTAHKAWYLFAILFAHTSSTLNFLIYGITNQSFREGYKCFLRRIFRGRGRN